MDCNHAQKLMMKYMDGLLSSEEAEKLNAHIRICPNCRSEFFVYDSIMENAEMIAHEKITAPEGFEKAVIAKIQAEKAPEYVFQPKDSLHKIFSLVFIALFALSYVLFANRDAAIAFMYKNNILTGYLDKIVPSAGTGNFYIRHMSDIINTVAEKADSLLSSMGIFILLLIIFFGFVQAAIYMRKHRNR